ncbi:MAG: DUF3866 family protein [Actinomycetota bacterium]
MSTYGTARVTGVTRWGPGAQEAGLRFEDGEEARGIVLTGLVGEVTAGDRVIVNTTAIGLGLGSGGYHYVLWNLERAELDTGGSGHVMKLRYTPLQLNVEAVEETLGALEDPSRAIAGMPVVAGELHSQLLPVALAYRDARPDGRLVYVMTDGGALPAALSNTVRFLRDGDYLQGVITCGQAFGGDLEAVTVFGALLGARERLGADAVVALMGPGIAGTGSAVGFSGLEQAVVLNACGSLGGLPLAIPRITFRDERARHVGLSHHTAMVLGTATHIRAVVPVPEMEGGRMDQVMDDLRAAGADEKHDIRRVDASAVLRLIDECGFPATVMGRGPDLEPEYFMAAGAAGILAAEGGY